MAGHPYFRRYKNQIHNLTLQEVQPYNLARMLKNHSRMGPDQQFRTRTLLHFEDHQNRSFPDILSLFSSNSFCSS
jgi:hypothetical protein